MKVLKKVEDLPIKLYLANTDDLLLHELAESEQADLTDIESGIVIIFQIENPIQQAAVESALNVIQRYKVAIKTYQKN